MFCIASCNAGCSYGEEARSRKKPGDSSAPRRLQPGQRKEFSFQWQSLRFPSVTRR